MPRSLTHTGSSRILLGLMEYSPISFDLTPLPTELVCPSLELGAARKVDHLALSYSSFNGISCNGEREHSTLLREEWWYKQVSFLSRKSYGKKELVERKTDSNSIGLSKAELTKPGLYDVGSKEGTSGAPVARRYPARLGLPLLIRVALRSPFLLFCLL